MNAINIKLSHVETVNRTKNDKVIDDTFIPNHTLVIIGSNDKDYYLHYESYNDLMECAADWDQCLSLLGEITKLPKKFSIESTTALVNEVITEK